MSVERERAGYSLAEALVALVLAGVLTICLAAILALVGRVAIRHAEVTAAAETERTVAAVLGIELRAATASDLSFGPDSVRLRAFRGRGIVCGVQDGMIAVAYEGARLPEEEKDSVLLVWNDREAAFDLTAVGSGSCGSESVVVGTSWLADSIAPPLVALVFETGAYSIGRSAFRYRRGSAGRQPLTEENLSTAGSGFGVVRGERRTPAVRVALRSMESRRAPPSVWLLGMLQGAMRP